MIGYLVAFLFKIKKGLKQVGIIQHDVGSFMNDGQFRTD